MCFNHEKWWFYHEKLWLYHEQMCFNHETWRFNDETWKIKSQRCWFHKQKSGFQTQKWACNHQHVGFQHQNVFTTQTRCGYINWMQWTIVWIGFMILLRVFCGFCGSGVSFCCILKFPGHILDPGFVGWKVLLVPQTHRTWRGCHWHLRVLPSQPTIWGLGDGRCATVRCAFLGFRMVKPEFLVVDLSLLLETSCFFFFLSWISELFWGIFFSK